MIKNIDKDDFKYLKILIPMSIIAFFSTLWIRPADLMEARNFITAREMVESQNYIIPTLNGALRFEKPPLPTWITAFIMNLTNNQTNEYILRIPSALVGVILVLLIYLFVKTLTKNSFKSFITAFIGCTTFMIIKLSGENSWDIYSYVFTFGAVTFFIRGLNNGKYLNFIVSAVLLSASILSKGPVAIYGLFIPFIIAHIVIYGAKDYKRNASKIILMLFISIVLAGIWPLLMYIKYPDIFINVLLKEKDTWTTKHTEPWFYYLDYFVYMGVWIFFSIFSLFKIYKLNLENREKNYSKFIFWWNIIIIISLSLVNMKKKRYGIPIYITSILEIGVICNYLYNKSWENLKRSEKYLIYFQNYFLIIISLAIPIVLLFKGYSKNIISLNYMLFLIAIFFSFGLIFFFTLLKKRNIIKYTILGSGILMLLINLTVNCYFDKQYINTIFDDPITKDYPNIEIVRENPPTYNIYSQDYEIEDVWRVGKKIHQYNSTINLPKKIVFWDSVPEKVLEEYKILKQEKYVKDDKKIVEINYLEKLEV